jgi:hypothetical protein
MNKIDKGVGEAKANILTQTLSIYPGEHEEMMKKRCYVSKEKFLFSLTFHLSLLFLPLLIISKHTKIMKNKKVFNEEEIDMLSESAEDEDIGVEDEEGMDEEYERRQIGE